MSVLTLGQELRLRHLIRNSAALAGVEHRLDAHRLVVTRDGREVWVPLAALTVAVAEKTPTEWQDTVEECLRGQLAAKPESDIVGRPIEEIRDGIFPRLLRVVDTESLAYAVPVLPGLARVIVLAEPHLVTILDDEQVARYDLARLIEVANANLRRKLTEMLIKIETYGGSYIVTGDGHTATMALELNALVERVIGEPLASAAAVAVPCENTLVFHVPEDIHGLPAAFEQVARLARPLHDASHQPLSPETHRWAPVGR